MTQASADVELAHYPQPDYLHISSGERFVFSIDGHDHQLLQVLFFAACLE
jgi:hypothetical protein